MFNQITTVAVAAALTALLLPSKGEAYGAAHVGYTHVGPNGVYHTGETAAYGPGGAYAGGRTSAYGAGGAEYRGGYAYGAERGGYGGERGGYAEAGYRYTPSYGGAYGGAAAYGYVR